MSFSNTDTFLNIQYTLTNTDNSEYITLNDKTTFDSAGKLYLLESMPKGLHDAELRQLEDVLSYRDGIMTGDVYLGKKAITFEVTLIATSISKMNEIITQCRKVLAPLYSKGYTKTYHTLTFTDIDEISKYINYQIGTLPSFEKEVNEQVRVKCLFSIKCDDPRYYSTTSTTVSLTLTTITGGLQVPAQVPAQIPITAVGGATCTNAGTYKSQPTTIISGPCTNPVIFNYTTGQYTKFNVTLGAAEHIYTNHATGETNKDGADNSSELDDSSTFIDLLPGDNYLAFSDDTLTGAATTEITYKSVWI